MPHNTHRHRPTCASALMALVLWFGSFQAQAQETPPSSLQEGTQVIRFSTAGFYPLENAGRTVENLNPGWRFAKGNWTDAWQADFKGDSAWQTVSTPHGLELLPVEASGGVNYRGEAWYRKYVTLPTGKPEPGKRYVLYFEGIMGKSKIWVNGRQVAEQYGGFLPIVVDISEALSKEPGAVQVIAVRADNSDDPDYPPGKPQAHLDYCYFGGIYRDVWLVTTGRTYISDPNQEDRIAGGGVFVATEELSADKKQARLAVTIDLNHDLPTLAKGHVELSLHRPDQTVVAAKEMPYSVAGNNHEALQTHLTVKNPQLWSPDTPQLYELRIRVLDSQGKTIDGLIQPVGIRTIAFDPAQGFVLNGDPYPRKLIGGNRHQDYAVIGNALSNNLHWRDVVKLKAAGMEVIRNAHYPQDPAFMDACDRLGMLVIVNTPGWQFWNEKPIFGERVYRDVRNMVRRDRNRPSVLLWEPILNETYYPDDFAKTTHEIVHAEYPYPGCYTASDSEAKGHEHFDVQFAHPPTGETEWAASHIDPTKVYFTREWGDNVDDWNSHNSPSRVARQWGEVPQLVQAIHYAKPDYTYSSYDALYRAPAYHFGGTLWHSFDHQRGYHPDPFYGGIMDAFRRPKYSFYMFQSQVRWNTPAVGPMVYIANELTPFSPQDVTVYSNCDSVKLHTFFGSEKIRTYRPSKDDREGLPSPVIVFPGAWDFMEDKALSRAGKQPDAYLLAEGYRDGKVVATHRRTMSRRPSKLQLVIDREGAGMTADGSDLVTVVAQITDGAGTVKRLNNQSVRFTIEGEGRLLIPASQQSGVPLLWGEAPVLVQSTTTPAKINVRAEIAGVSGDWTAEPAEIEFTTQTSLIPLLYRKTEMERITDPMANDQIQGNAANRQQLEQQLKEVEAQQEAFGEQR